MSPRPPFPPFTEEAARQKVQAAEDGFQYESHNSRGQWFRSYGNELWEFTDEGLMSRREASINDLPIDPASRRIHGPGPAASTACPSPCADPRVLIRHAEAAFAGPPAPALTGAYQGCQA